MDGSNSVVVCARGQRRSPRQRAAANDQFLGLQGGCPGNAYLTKDQENWALRIAGYPYDRGAKRRGADGRTRIHGSCMPGGRRGDDRSLRNDLAVSFLLLPLVDAMSRWPVVRWTSAAKRLIACPPAPFARPWAMRAFNCGRTSPLARRHSVSPSRKTPVPEDKLLRGGHSAPARAAASTDRLGRTARTDTSTRADEPPHDGKRANMRRAMLMQAAAAWGGRQHAHAAMCAHVDHRSMWASAPMSTQIWIYQSACDHQHSHQPRVIHIWIFDGVATSSSRHTYTHTHTRTPSRVLVMRHIVRSAASCAHVHVSRDSGRLIAGCGVVGGVIAISRVCSSSAREPGPHDGARRLVRGLGRVMLASADALAPGRPLDGRRGRGVAGVASGVGAVLIREPSPRLRGSYPAH
jgi:hypothetical protein